jgi:hypothetical protein
MYLLLISASGGIGAAANHTPHAWWWAMEPTKAPDWIIQPCQWFGSAFLVLRLGHGAGGGTSATRGKSWRCQRRRERACGILPGPGDRIRAPAHHTRTQGGHRGLGWAAGPRHRSMLVSGPSHSVVCNCHTHTEGEETAGWSTRSAAGILGGYFSLHGHLPWS